MSSNEQIILDRVLEERRSNVASDLGQDAFFTIFAIEQVLKDLDLSFDEIEAGLVDAGGDGGIDGFYVFLNGQYVAEDTEDFQTRQGAVVEVAIIQASRTAGFKELQLDRLVPTLTDLLDLSRDLTEFSDTYNERLLTAAGNFRRTFLALAATYPKIRFRIYYVSRATEVHPNVERKVAQVAATVANAFHDAEFDFEFVDATRLLRRAQTARRTVFELRVADTFSSGDVGFVCLVPLADYHRFITDEAGRLQAHLFESNVRDYQGSVEVNQAIRRTLDERLSEDFWWLNNGITVVASRASLAGKTLTLQDPQVVNGLQTSTEIHSHFQEHPEETDGRHVLVRAVVPSNEESRDRIIRATNSQIAIPAAYLRATDPLHRDIEDYFRTHDLYYDRRKNQYKNQGKPKERIVTIPYLAQAVMATVLHEPDNARARPSSLLKSDEDYQRVFNSAYPIDVYLKAARLMRRIDKFLGGKDDLSTNARNNVRFHLAYCISARKTGTPEADIAKFAATDFEDISHDELEECLPLVGDVFYEMAEAGDTPDQIAKSRATVEALRYRLAEDGS